MGDHVRVSSPREHVLLVELTRPEALNALNAGLVEELREVLGGLRERRDVRCVVLTGEGRGFCSGLDLRGYGRPPGARKGDGRPQARLRVQQHIADLADLFRSAPPPVICAINGVASGGGMALALLCDVRVVGESARLLPSFVTRGLSGCDMGVSWLLPRIVGFSTAFEMLLTARPIDAARAVETGIASAVVADDRLLDEVFDMASLIASHSPFGTRMTKEVMWANLEVSSLRAAVEIENRTQILATFTDDHREAVRAFVERRPAQFHDR